MTENGASPRGHGVLSVRWLPRGMPVSEAQDTVGRLLGLSPKVRGTVLEGPAAGPRGPQWLRIQVWLRNRDRLSEGHGSGWRGGNEAVVTPSNRKLARTHLSSGSFTDHQEALGTAKSQGIRG